VTAGSAGGKNAALLAVEMLALSDAALAAKLKDFRKAQADKVLADDAALQAEVQQ
jgi:phosphoribosylcarboxyaminoimidazole (NCAIR) mutase